jgi:hypothetical protein
MELDTAIYTYSVAVAFALVTAAAVPITYSRRSKGEWRKHAYGRHLMGSDSVLVVILGYYFLASLVDYPVAERLVAAALMFIFGIYRIQRVRFMRRSTQSTGYDNKDAVYGENERDHR